MRHRKGRRIYRGIKPIGILDSSSGNLARIKSMTDLRILASVGSAEAKYCPTELNFGDFISFRLFVERFFIEGILAPNDKGQPTPKAFASWLHCMDRPDHFE